MKGKEILEQLGLLHGGHLAKGRGARKQDQEGSSTCDDGVAGRWLCALVGAPGVAGRWLCALVGAPDQTQPLDSDQA